jgi:hypothetical protein
MPMKRPSRLHPRSMDEVVAKEEEVFNPEAGRASDDPFGEHIAPSQEQATDSQEAPLQEAASNEEVSEYDEDTQDKEN